MKSKGSNPYIYEKVQKRTSKLVYCKNCKHLKDDLWSHGGYKPTSYYCNSSNNLEILSTPLTTELNYKKTPFEINNNNDCKYYKRKWYLFWVK